MASVRKRGEITMFQSDLVKDIKAVYNTQKLFIGKFEEWETHYKNYGVFHSEDILLEAIKLSERFTNQVRLLSPNTFMVNYEDKLTDIFIKEQDLAFEVLDDHGFKLTLPFMLPKKKDYQSNARYYRTIIEYYLQKVSWDMKISRITEPVTLLFIHGYDKDRDQSKWRDHDNIELNVVVDRLATYLITDDNGYNCKHFYASQTAEKNQCEVFIIKNRYALEYIANYLE